MNKMHVIHMLICFIYSKIFESGILVSAMSTVLEDTNGCAKQYRHVLDIYLITALSSSYGIIMDLATNTPGHGNNIVDGLNATDKRYLTGKWNLLVNKRVTRYQRLECFPVLQKMPPLHLENNIYTSSIIKTG